MILSWFWCDGRELWQVHWGVKFKRVPTGNFHLFPVKSSQERTSLMVQWLRLTLSMQGSIPGGGKKIYFLAEIIILWGF